jgi:hypothetical protein
MDRWAWGASLISGSSLPLLYTLESTGGGWGAVMMVLLGGGAALTAQRALGPMPKSDDDPIRDCVFLVSSLAEMCLTGATIFLQADRVDSDVGAGLCVIPLFHAACMHGTSDPQYRRYTQALVGFLGLGVLSYSTFIAYSDGRAEGPAITMPDGEASILLLLNAAYACSGDSLTSIAARASVLATLAAQPWVLGPLLQQRQEWGLFVLQMATLIHSTLIQGGEVRGAITRIRAAISAEDGVRIRRAQRTLMLCVAPALTLAFAIQRWPWVDWLWFVVYVQMCWGLLWAYKTVW